MLTNVKHKNKPILHKYSFSQFIQGSFSLMPLYYIMHKTRVDLHHAPFLKIFTIKAPKQHKKGLLRKKI